MLKFFRSIRKNLLATSKTGKYFQYAIGEVVLVVIGILFALQINNWNTERIAQSSIHNYYERIHLEVDEEIKVMERFGNNAERLKSMNKRTLKILNSQNYDSIPALRETLGALGTAWSLNVSFPVTQEFLAQGYLSKIKNDSIKSAFKDFTLVMENIRGGNEYLDRQYNDRIEPFINKHINYSEVALPMYRGELVQGGPLTDFESLFSNLELWNVVTFKLETLNGDIKGNKSMIERLKNFNAQIRKELKQSNPKD